MEPMTAFLYPGQGRLPRTLASRPEDVSRLYERAAAQGLPLLQWMQDDPQGRLSFTDAAQPALFLDAIARDRALRTAGASPMAVGGHSLGEYAALVGAGVLSAEDALEIVIERGRLMREIDGAMVAILKLDIADVKQLCEAESGDVVVANHNAPEQVVVSGRSPAVRRVSLRAAEQGGRCIPLPVSGPFHSPFMQPAEAALRPTIEQTTFLPPSVPVVSGVSGKPETDPEELKRLLTRQITSCVQWVAAVKSLASLGVRRAIEVGSGDTLTRLGRRITSTVLFIPFEEVDR